MTRFILLDTESLNHVGVVTCAWCDALVPTVALEAHRTAVHKHGVVVECERCFALVPFRHLDGHWQAVHVQEAPSEPAPPVLPIGGAS